MSDFNEKLAEALREFNRKTRADEIRNFDDEDLSSFLHAVVHLELMRVKLGLGAMSQRDWFMWLREEATENERYALCHALRAGADAEV